MLKLTANTRSFEQSVAYYSGAADTTLKQAWRRALRGLVRRVMGITPPANQESARGEGGTLTLADKKRGERAIARDLRIVFFGIERQKVGPRGQDPAPIHERLFRQFKKPGRKLRRDRPDPYFVDQVLVRRLERTLQRRVGKLASGWNSGAEALGVKGPAWVARHGTRRGTHRLLFGFLRYKFEMGSTSVPGELVPELDRRIRYAMTYTGNALEREAAAILLKAGRDSGFDTRR